MLTRKDASFICGAFREIKRQIDDPNYAKMIYSKLHISPEPPKQTYENLILQTRKLQVRCEE